jgi:agmatine deiminase
MPAEWAPHERTLMAWPAREELWGAEMAAAKREYALTVAAIVRFEPLLLVADEGDGDEAAAACPDAEVIELPIDDSWLRDSGPIYVLEDDGSRVGLDFGFNAWGGKFPPWDDDAAVTGRLLEHLGHPRRAVDMILEGGAIAVDGEGRLVTTERCLLSPTRNPAMGREDIERVLRDELGVEQVVWLPDGLAEDRDTDGHVDMACAFTAPGRVLLQTVADPDNPNHAIAEESRRRLDAAGVEVDPLPFLAYTEHGGERVPASYMNFYVANGGVVVPVPGAPQDDEALALIGERFPGREAVGVPAETIAKGGGGVHCITQQVPAARA